jgi:hypothetical protein
MCSINKTQGTRAWLFVGPTWQIQLGINLLLLLLLIHRILLHLILAICGRGRGLMSFLIGQQTPRLVNEIHPRRSTMILGSLSLPHTMIGHQAHHLFATLARHNGPIADAPQKCIALPQEFAKLLAPNAHGNISYLYSSTSSSMSEAR